MMMSRMAERLAYMIKGTSWKTLTGIECLTLHCGLPRRMGRTIRCILVSNNLPPAADTDPNALQGDRGALLRSTTATEVVDLFNAECHDYPRQAAVGQAQSFLVQTAYLNTLELEVGSGL
jgi:hypothetical protein